MIVSSSNKGNSSTLIWHTNVTTTESLGTLYTRLIYISGFNRAKGSMLPSLAQEQEIRDKATLVTVRVSTMLGVVYLHVYIILIKNIFSDLTQANS